MNQIAGYLGVSASIVRRLVRERKIPFNRIEGRIVFFLPVVREWLRERTVRPVHDQGEANGSKVIEEFWKKHEERMDA